MQVRVVLLYEHTREQSIEYSSRSPATRAEPAEIQQVLFGSDQNGVVSLLTQSHTVQSGPDSRPDIHEVRDVLRQFVADYNALGNGVELRFRYADGSLETDLDDEPPHCELWVWTEEGWVVYLNWDCDAIPLDPTPQAVTGTLTGTMHVGIRSEPIPF